MIVQTPDTRPGHYYVTCIKDGKYWPMAGPFNDDHAAALAAVHPVREAAYGVDPRTHWLEWGTSRLPHDFTRPGPLNHAIGA